MNPPQALQGPAGRGEPAESASFLEAAGEIFADCGYEAATVCAICERAAANLAAVSYHFGDKERPYLAALRHAHECTVAKYPPGLAGTVAEAVSPLFRALESIVRDVLGPEASPGAAQAPGGIEALADHVTRFALGGLGSCFCTEERR